MLERTTTEIMSDAPMTISAMQLSVMLRLRPKRMVAAPKRPTQKSMVLPARRLMGEMSSVRETASAPSDGMARNRPRPLAPECRMSEAKMGISEAAPPSRTANRSSEMEPSRRRVPMT